jgi:hypothetical protein
MIITIITYILLIVGVVLSILWYVKLIKNIPKEGFSSDRNKHSLYDCQGTKQAWCTDECNISSDKSTCKVRCPGVKPKGAGWLDCKSNPFTKLSSGCHKDWSVINSGNRLKEECLTAKRNFKQEHYKNMCTGVLIFNDEEKGVSEEIKLPRHLGLERERMIIGGERKGREGNMLFWDPNHEFQNSWSKKPIKGVCKSRMAEDGSVLSKENALHFPYSKLCGVNSYFKEECLPNPQGCGMNQSKSGQDLRC